MTLAEALRQAEEQLAARGSEEARLEAELLLCQALRLTRAQLYTHFDDGLTPGAAAEFQQLLGRRLRREPLAYILGHKEFFGLDFLVDERVLIPRPETELLVEAAIARARGTQGCRIIDVGTGSGCIAISLALHLPQATIYASDISPQALEVAAANCARHGVAERIRLLLGDMLSPLPEPVDIIVADLPYVSEIDLMTVLAEVPPGIYAGEPLLALSGGPDGLDCIRQLLSQAPEKLRPGGAILFEIGYEQGQAALELSRRCFPAARLRLHQDLAGLDRMVAIET